MSSVTEGALVRDVHVHVHLPAQICGRLCEALLDNIGVLSR